MNCVLLHEKELWLPVSISSQAAVNNHRGKKYINAHCIYTYFSKKQIIKASLGAELLPSECVCRHFCHSVEMFFTEICFVCIIVPLHAVSDSTNIITAAEALPI